MDTEITIDNASTTDATNLSRRLAPEDIRQDMYVAVMAITYETLPFFCETAYAAALAEGRPCRVTFLPSGEQLQPLKVVSVCLPFVFVMDAQKQRRMLDVRRYAIAQVSKTFGKAYFKAVREQIRRDAKASKEQPSKK